LMMEDFFPIDFDQTLGKGIRDRPDSPSESGREYDRLHDLI